MGNDVQQLRLMLETHFAWHRRTTKQLQWAVGTIGGLLIGLIAWGASEFRGQTTALSREQCTAVATQVAERARSEHAELRAADQRLADEQNKQSRELQQLAMHRLAEQREARPK